MRARHDSTRKELLDVIEANASVIIWRDGITKTESDCANVIIGAVKELRR